MKKNFNYFMKNLAYVKEPNTTFLLPSSEKNSIKDVIKHKEFQFYSYHGGKTNDCYLT